LAPKLRIGKIHEAAFLFRGNPQTWLPYIHKSARLRRRLIYPPTPLGKGGLSFPPLYKGRAGVG
jgi:hypothetical protein